jgi:hypothetical protein
MNMSIHEDPSALQDLDVALRRVAAELDDGAFRRRLAAERARERWRGGHRRRFDDACAELDTLTRRTAGELAALRRALRTLTDGAA